MRIGETCWIVPSLLIVSLAVSGCSVGPSYVRGSRTRYNEAIQCTAGEEMLLNLVRTRYGESPGFLAVSSITTQFEVNGLVGFGNELGLGAGRWNGSLNAADRPTISLTPLQDEQFTRRFLSPISLDTIYIFTRNGRRLEPVLRLVVDQMNGVMNASGNLGSSQQPGAFVWVAQTLGELAKQQEVELAYNETIEKSPALAPSSLQGADVVAALGKGYRFETSAENKSVILAAPSKELVLRLSPTSVGSPEVEGIAELLRLHPGRTSYPIEAAVEGQLKSALTLQDELHVSTRSVEEILHFLSDGVTVPGPHMKRGLAEHRDGTESGCPDSASDLLRIHCSKRHPHQALVAVRYRGFWFYIDDADGTSKETFELLLELYNLEIRGGGAAALPFLTLPIGR